MLWFQVYMLNFCSVHLGTAFLCTAISKVDSTSIPADSTADKTNTIVGILTSHTHMVVPRHKTIKGTYQAFTTELRIEDLSIQFLVTASESAQTKQLKQDIHKALNTLDSKTTRPFICQQL